MYDLTLIRKLCQEKGITLKALAEKIGITQAGIQYILQTNTTKIVTLKKIADVLDVDIAYFLLDNNGKDEKTIHNEILFYKDKYYNLLEQYNQLLVDYVELIKDKDGKKSDSK